MTQKRIVIEEMDRFEILRVYQLYYWGACEGQNGEEVGIRNFFDLARAQLDEKLIDDDQVKLMASEKLKELRAKSGKFSIHRSFIEVDRMENKEKIAGYDATIAEGEIKPSEEDQSVSKMIIYREEE
jgi:hypothetical protein